MLEVSVELVFLHGTTDHAPFINLDRDVGGYFFKVKPRYETIPKCIMDAILDDRPDGFRMLYSWCKLRGYGLPKEVKKHNHWHTINWFLDGKLLSVDGEPSSQEVIKSVTHKKV